MAGSTGWRRNVEAGTAWLNIERPGCETRWLLQSGPEGMGSRIPSGAAPDGYLTIVKSLASCLPSCMFQEIFTFSPTFNPGSLKLSGR